jgi:hypothetical protein
MLKLAMDTPLQSRCHPNLWEIFICGIKYALDNVDAKFAYSLVIIYDENCIS